jgi:cysteine synthase
LARPANVGRSSAGTVDRDLLRAFEREIWGRIPRADATGLVANPTPLVDLTQALRDCARLEYGLDLSGKDFKVFGKMESPILGGSVKTRPAAHIIHRAIESGKLRSGMTLFEATSGNFGISLGALSRLDLNVVVLVSRKLQEGVLQALEKSGVKTVNLDIEICPAPGMQADPNLLMSRVVASSMRERFSELGLDLGVFDANRKGIEEALSRQDAINLAKLLAEAYGGFCPEQYDNDDNVGAHLMVTGPEIEQQLEGLGYGLSGFPLVCAFGTGGTSGGLSRYTRGRLGGKKVVHVVFPREGQDVAGIRTKANATGLKFYEPETYAGQHEVDFVQAKRLFAFMVKSGFDMGESSALALYATLQMVNFGVGEKFVVILADGAGKYGRALEETLEEEAKEEDESLEVTVEGVRANPEKFGKVLWAHTGYVPSDEGKGFLASSLGRKDDIAVARATDVIQSVTGQAMPTRLKDLVGDSGKRVLVVCMSGNTSLRVVQLLKKDGIKAQSLSGGISRLAQSSGKPVARLVQPASS